MARRKALINGITGQDGSYLAELLLEKGYEVHGMVRRMGIQDPQRRTERIVHLRNLVHLHAGSLDSFPSILKLFAKLQPDECYHLAAQSFVACSFEDEFSTMNTNVNGTHYVLSALKDLAPNCRFYFAASSEMFGKVEEVPQRETTRFHPRSPYAISKLSGYELTRYYREAYNIHASSGILFNHESPRRGCEFVTRKITSGIADILAGKTNELRLGNLDALRDWGHSRDYVQAMWLMLQKDAPDDYVVATGETHSVREFLTCAFSFVGLDWQKYVAIAPEFYRPAEVQLLLGDASKALAQLGWQRTTSFHALVEEMVGSDCEATVTMMRAIPEPHCRVA